jgi:large subunit ribosomal protein MRP49
MRSNLADQNNFSSLQLRQVRLGLGAAVFPPTAPITRLHLTYAVKADQGHHGARKFWRLCLPRIKFYNPAVGITVKQIQDQSAPALLSIYHSSTSPDSRLLLPATTTTTTKTSKNAAAAVADSFAPAPGEEERVVTLDVKGKDVSEIWSQVRDLTKAEEIQPTEEDLKEMEVAEQEMLRSERDRKRMAAIVQAQRDQQAMLRAAREDVQKLRAD